MGVSIPVLMSNAKIHPCKFYYNAIFLPPRNIRTARRKKKIHSILLPSINPIKDLNFIVPIIRVNFVDKDILYINNVAKFFLQQLGDNISLNYFINQLLLFFFQLCTHFFEGRQQRRRHAYINIFEECLTCI